MVVAAILAAGSGTRFGSDKVNALLGGKPLWWHSFDRFRRHPEVGHVLLVGAEDALPGMRALAPEASLVAGGSTRQASAAAALGPCPADATILLFHDAARPFPSAELISRVIEAVQKSGASAPASSVTDTLREVEGEATRLLDRDRIVAMQTPQGALVELWQLAHEQAKEGMTDDIALLEAIGVQPEFVSGDPENFKITFPADWRRAQDMLGSVETRTGLGYDVHRFSTDSSRLLVLGGVPFPGEQGLEGHSDADVAIHAAVDALLGAAALGDIGRHFPPSEPRWRGEPSATFLTFAHERLQQEGWEIVNLDIAIIAERPRIMARAHEIRTCLADCLNLSVDRVNIKATTNEGLGSLGRGEGIAAFATAAIRRG